MNKKEFKTKVFGIIVDYVHDDLFKTDNCVKSIDEFWYYLQSFTQKKIDEEREKYLTFWKKDNFRGQHYTAVFFDEVEDKK